jgi:Ni/Fe-hydrogenase subunit HybB-like protein
VSTAPSNPEREELLFGVQTNAELSDQLLSTTWRSRSRTFGLLVIVTGSGTLVLSILIGYTLLTGIGVWGTTIPVAWAFDIINFVWWIGIGHAGAFISAFLFLLEQKWRTSIHRLAEAMTLSAVVQAAMVFVLHLGRPWFAYWLVPYPATMRTWPNFKSAMPWDVAATLAYGTISFAFWYLGLIPDLASVRDRAPTRIRRIIYGIFAFGWRGSAEHFRHYRIAYGLLAGLAASLAVFVHSIVSSHFATTLVPGWHSTIFPPYFVAGSLFSGFAMILTLVIPVRSIFGMQNVITKRHLENLARLTLVCSWVVLYSYVIEFFVAWYSAERYDRYIHFDALLKGHSSWVFGMALTCNCLAPQLLWWRRVRRQPVLLWLISVVVNIGVWSEHYSIIVLALQQAFLPSSWGEYHPKWVDWGILFGTVSFFLFLFLLFLRIVPFIPLAALKEVRERH